MLITLCITRVFFALFSALDEELATLKKENLSPYQRIDRKKN
jgi:hypothetical protein